jgi:hypothetical protein
VNCATGLKCERKYVTETLIFLAEGSRISRIARVKEHKEDSILTWLREAAEHAEAVEQVLLPTHKQAQPNWQYLQVVKQRENGRVVGTQRRVLFGDK